MDWQPIETAPKDGAEFLAWGEYGDSALVFELCRWSPEYDWPVADDGYHFIAYHWMPLPEPPTA